MEDTGLNSGPPAASDSLAGAGPLVEQTVRGALEEHIASVARAAIDRGELLDTGQIERLAVQAAQRQLADLADPPGLYYLTVEERVGEWLFPVYRRSVLGHDRVWCPQWWRHAEAVARLESLWRAWEHLRQDAATGLSVWFRDHADHHMTILSSTPTARSKAATATTPAGRWTSCRMTRRPPGCLTPTSSQRHRWRRHERATPATARNAGPPREHTIRRGR